MELYNTDNVEADIERIKEKIETHYAERLANGSIKFYEIDAHYVNMNRFTASVEYLPTKDGKRFGAITAHYEILIRNGRIEFQHGL